jgi:hypothetical protein
MTNLEACTDEKLEQALARVLTYASGEVLNDAEVQKFYQLYEEIQRRALATRRQAQAQQPNESYNKRKEKQRPTEKE